MQTLPFNLQPEQISAFARKWSLREISLFGSVLRAEFRPDSDVDILIAFDQGKTLTFESYVAMREELSALFNGREIDLVEECRLNDPYRRHEIMRTREPIYGN